MTASKFTADLFNFADLTDLPEDIQGKLHRDGDDKAKEWAGIVQAAVAHGIKSLGITQIIAVATRAKLNVPGEQTVRNYLNRAVELKLIGKPTRVTYGDVKDHVEAVEGEATEAAPAAADNEDPLAGL